MNVMQSAEDAFKNYCIQLDDGSIIATACIELTVGAYTSFADPENAGVLNFYNEFLSRFGTEIKWSKTNTEGNFKKVNAKRLQLLPQWVADRDSRQKNLLGIELKGGNSEKDMRLPAFNFFHSGTSDGSSAIYSIFLPIDNGNDISEMMNFINRAFLDFPLLSGYVGYGVYWDTLDFIVEKEFYKKYIPNLYENHPGIVLANPMSLRPRITEGLMGVSWLTLLGSEALCKLGGIQSLASKLGDEHVKPLHCANGGACIISGDRPLLGNLAQGDDLPSYKRVGHALKDARFPGTFYAGGLDNSMSHQWFMRFFD